MGWGEYTSTSLPYVTENGEKTLKVVEPYYSKEKRIIEAFCPHCGLMVDRLWNLDYCGSCGERLSWHDLRVKDYGDVT